MASYDQVSLEARPRLPADTETPVDIKEPSRVLVQGGGAFSLEGEVGRGDTQGDRQSWFLGALPPVSDVYPFGWDTSLLSPEFPSVLRCLCGALSLPGGLELLWAEADKAWR